MPNRHSPSSASVTDALSAMACGLRFPSFAVCTTAAARLPTRHSRNSNTAVTAKKSKM